MLCQAPGSRRCRFSGNAPIPPTCSLPGLSPPAAQDTAFLSVSLFKAARKSRQQTCHRIEKAAMFRPFDEPFSKGKLRHDSQKNRFSIRAPWHKQKTGPAYMAWNVPVFHGD